MSPSSPTPSVEKDGKEDYFVDEKASFNTAQSGPRTLYVDGIKINVDPRVPPLADGEEEKRWGWLDLFKKNKDVVDWDSVATRPSVFDDANLAPHYAPMSKYENLHRVDPLARWTFAEEKKLIRKTDWRVMAWMIVMFLALDLDRSNITQANSANFLTDLKLNTNDFNLGNTLAKLGFLIAELPSQLISKKVGPDRWIPTQMCLWSFVAGSQFFLSGRSSFLVTRFLVGLCQGGFIPDVILYMSYFYKKSELSMRLALFFTCNFSVDIISGFLAIGLLQLDGTKGYSGWRWLFLIEALLTLTVGLITFFNMPPSPTHTRTWFRPNGWYTEREEIIMTNRILRDDPGKGLMHNRQAISFRMLWESICDFDLWPLYGVGLVFQLPSTPIKTYLTLAFRQLGFTTVETNLLSIPNLVIAIINLIGVAALTEAVNEKSFVCSLQNIWTLPCLIALYCLPGDRPWSYFAAATVLLGAPYVHAVVVSWVSMNAGSVRTRTVGSSLYNMMAQVSGIIGSQVYRKDDAPLYRRGNKALIGVCVMNIILFPLIKVYYIQRNKYKRKQWESLSPQEQADYLDSVKERGSKRLDFQFFH